MYKILLVDDNYVHLQSLLSYIEPEEFNISGIKISQSGYEALEICKEFKPDVVITDISMPEINGMELTKQIRAMGIDPQFIYISCYDDVEYFRCAIENEVLAYLMKPIIPEELKNAIQKAISRAAKNTETANSLQLGRENYIYRLLSADTLEASRLYEAAPTLLLQNFKHFILVKAKFLEAEEDVFSTYRDLKEFSDLQNRGIVPVILPEGTDTMLILFMSEKNNNFQDTIRSVMCNKIKDLFDRYAVTVKAGASDTGGNLFELKSLQKQADSALKTNLELIRSDYIAYSDISVKNVSFNFIAYNETVSNLVRADVSATEISQFIKTFNFTEPEYDETLLKELYLSTVSSIQSVLLKNGIDIAQIVGRTDLSYHKINRFSDPEHFLIWLRNILTLTGEYLKNYKGKSQFALVQKTINYIHKNFSTISSIEEIASQLFVSYSHLRNVFKKELGITIYDYLLSVRMEEAKKLLSTSKMNLTQIAYKVGYSDYDYFKTVFAKYNGITPREYQQSNQKTPEN
ncbi:MAG: response regulator [Ruminococcaceae bacterium]|nr:response regulator [Oscillospiraceae bacterium]